MLWQIIFAIGIHSFSWKIVFAFEILFVDNKYTLRWTRDPLGNWLTVIAISCFYLYLTVPLFAIERRIRSPPDMVVQSRLRSNIEFQFILPHRFIWNIRVVISGNAVPYSLIFGTNRTCGRTWDIKLRFGGVVQRCRWILLTLVCQIDSKHQLKELHVVDSSPLGVRGDSNWVMKFYVSGFFGKRRSRGDAHFSLSGQEKTHS